MSEATPPVRDDLLPPQTTDQTTWPLTSDALDTDGGNALTGITTPPGVITPAGFAGNGYNARASGTLPAWAAVAAAKMSFHTIARAIAPPAVIAWREVGASVTTTTNDTPKFELAVCDDQAGHSVGVFALRAYNGAIVRKDLNRVGWRFEFRSPEPVALGTPAPQALCWLDADTLLMVATRGSTSVLYRWDVPSQQYTGRASSTTLTHINSLHLAPSGGEVWLCTTTAAGDKRKRLDLATSFSTGAITTDSDWNTGDVPTSSLSFATVGSVEYALLTAFDMSGTSYCYVFLRSQMAGTVTQVDRVKRFVIGLRVQDLVQRVSDGLIYVSRALSPGKIDAYDLAAILVGADGATPAPVSTYPSPTILSEGLDFHPTTDRLWCCSEGILSAADLWSHCAVWSSALGAVGEDTSYLIDYIGGEVQVRLNGRLMHQFSHTPTVAPAKLAVCAAATSTAGQSGFLQTGGYVRSVAISSQPFTPTEFAALQT